MAVCWLSARTCNLLPINQFLPRHAPHTSKSNCSVQAIKRKDLRQRGIGIRQMGHGHPHSVNNISNITRAQRRREPNSGPADLTIVEEFSLQNFVIRFDCTKLPLSVFDISLADTKAFEPPAVAEPL